MRILNGKRALITGAGGGLGRELSLAFVREGVEIVATDINQASLDETLELVESTGGSALGFKMDVTQVDDVQLVRQELHRQRGPIDVLINNAGIVRGGPFLQIGMDEHRAILNVNALGPMTVTHAFLPDLISRAEAHCITIASASGMIPMPLQISYSASKWFALGFSDAIREELRLKGQRHVHVTSVCPSYLDTDMFHGVRLPLLTKALSSAEVARQVVRAVKANRTHLLTPWIVNLIPLGKTLPLWVGEKVCDWLGVSDGMRDWVGNGSPHADAPAKPNVTSVEFGPDRRVTLN